MVEEKTRAKYEKRGDPHEQDRRSSARELRQAMALYSAAISSSGSRQEAELIRRQIEGMVRSIVPDVELIRAQVKIAISYLEDAARTPEIQERDTVDEEWNVVKRRRRREEINRRVQEKWRGPY